MEKIDRINKLIHTLVEHGVDHPYVIETIQEFIDDWVFGSIVEGLLAVPRHLLNNPQAVTVVQMMARDAPNLTSRIFDKRMPAVLARAVTMQFTQDQN